MLDSASGEVVESRGFDTASNEYESEALADYLMQLEEGYPVLIASSGDAGAHLTQSALDALRSIGADVELDDLQGRYFAIAGVTGAADGSAESVVDDSEAYLSVSLNRDHRPLAAAVDKVTIEPAP